MGGGDAQGSHTEFQQGIEQHGPLQVVGKAAERPAPQCQAGKEGADATGDGVDLNADHQ
ncbi:hypothetical protein D9M71_351000 [compost metagenome]